jgi:peptidoglycan/xylan/chitin deacetylase (PgdA/CDA1 family)
MTSTAVPVIMYHSVGIPAPDWNSWYLTCPYQTFRDHLVWLQCRGYHTLTLDELYGHMKEGAGLPRKPVVITFDDGYADNWVFAYPLLKQYGFSATVYVNPEFVDPRPLVRRRVDEVPQDRIDTLEERGYLSWNELQQMEQSGVMSIQSHTMTHTWYPISKQCIDFRHPGDPYTWITWNRHGGEKPFLQKDRADLVEYGEPVYEHDRAIGSRRYFPDESPREYMIDLVKKKKDPSWFTRDTWRDELKRKFDAFVIAENGEGRYETDEEYKKRVIYEIAQSKKILEEKLQKPIRFLCWPGGAVTQEALEIARDAGYLSSTIGKDLASQRKRLKNRFGEDPSRINRINPVLHWNGKKGSASRIQYKTGSQLLWSMYQFASPGLLGGLSTAVLLGYSKWAKWRSRDR